MAKYAGRALWRLRKAAGKQRNRSLKVEQLEPRVVLAPVGLPTLPTLGLPEQGFDFLPEPRLVRDGVWFLGTGPSPEELRMRGTTNIAAADTTNTDQLWNGGGLNLNLNGSGLTVGVWDEAGVRGSHQEFGGRVTYGDNASFFSDHATHVAGTIAATGVNASARGMANQASIISYDWTSDMGELGNAPAAMVASNHSYGFLQGWARYNILGGGTEDTWFEDRALFTEERDFGKYSSDARSLDQVLANRPNLLSVWSAGNDRDDAFTNFRQDQTYVAYFSSGLGTAGYYRVNTSQYSAPASDGNNGTGYDSMEGNKNSKNSLVIGAVNDATADPIVPSTVSTAVFSSYGPTDDGRIKPDLVANGVGLNSSLAGSDSHYGNFSGTSMAAPNATGTATLLIEHYKNLYGTLPKSATTKNLLIHTALDVGNFGPDFATGWGLIDAARAATTLTTAHSTSAAAMLQETTFTGTTKSFTFNALGDQPLKATIVWTDPAGNAHSSTTLDQTTAVLVNNLDLKITGPGGTYLPWTLSGSNPTALAVRNKANTVDNVEQVLIDNPTAGTYTVTVTGPASTTQNFTIIVSQDEPEVTNDNQPPTVELINKITSIPENANTSAGIKVADIVITDDNLGTNVLSIEGTNREMFELRNGTELWLVAGAVLNFESLPTLNVTVEVDDDTIAGEPDDSESLAISIGDVNEAPTALALSANTVQENKAAGTTVGTFSTTDPDAASTTFTYSLVAGDGASNNSSFIIVDGVLKTDASFDYETQNSYSILVRTTDGGGLFFERAFTIAVLDVNEAPTLLLQNTTSALLENRDTSTRIKIADIVIVDDALGTNSLSLTGADASLFEIDARVLYLKAGVALDHETKPTLNVTVAVDDASVGSSPDDTAALAISIDNVNEAPTALALSNNTVDENLASGATLGTLSTVDPDAGDTFTYTLVSGTGDADNGSFTIDAGVLKTAASFDFEAQSSYSIRVQSKDAGGLTKVAIFTINVNDLNEAPTALALSNNTVNENLAVGTTVGTLSTTDPDAGDSFTYTLVAGTGDADNATFTIEAGALKTAASFDFEAQSSYSIRVQSKDTGGLTKVVNFTINVANINEGPTALALSSNTVNENLAAGTTVGTLSTTDPDAGDSFTYTLVAGTGDADNGSFTIEAGVLKTAASFDFEAKSSYSIRMQSKDAGGLTKVAIFTINVNDLNEVPTALSLTSNTVNENLAAGATIGTLSTTDPDAGDTFAYTLVAGTGDADNASFTIEAGVLKTSASFDFEAKSSYSIRVQCKDAGGLTKVAIFTITVNDLNEAPAALALSNNTVNENLAAGTTVGTLSTTDPDAGDSFTYTLVAGTGDADNASFTIEAGALKTAASFDFEAKSSYSIRVQTKDAGGLTKVAIFTITVNDFNEAPTDLLLSNNTVAEGAAAGTVVGTFDTVDPDAEDTFAYTLVSGTGSDDNASFEIVEGVLKTVEELNFDLQSSYSIRVRTSDGSLSLEKVFTITLEDVNHAPTDLAISTASVDENFATGTAVGSFSTTDADAGETFTYTLVVGEGDDDNGAFEIVDGVLRTLASFDFEAKSSYSIRVRTTDSGGQTFAKAFTISINDINEAPTQLSLSGSSVNENLAAGATVGTFSATDPDAGDALQYMLVAGEGDDDNGSFEIVDGVLKTLDRFNYEAQNSYTIRVRTTDLGDLSTEQVFTITINDVNEAPVLDNSLSPKLTTTAEDAAIPAKTQVAALLAGAVTDPDLGALRGIAVNGASNYHGLWQYSLDGGSSWIGVGSVSNTSALLLPGWAWVRFLPKPDFNGEVKLFYRAWDQTQGKPGERLNTQGNLGGDKSLSVAWESAQLTVSPVNDAPRLDNTLSPALKSIWEDAKAPAGTLVTDLVKGAISDVDQGAAQGIAVIGAGASNGTWQYRLNGSTVWQGMGEIGESSALLLNADAGTRVRFIPASNFNGDVALYYRAWDRTLGQAGAKLSLIGKYGGTNAFSTAREGATLTVIPVNDRPVVKFSSTTGYQLNRAAITLAPNATVYDVDSADFDGGRLRVHIGSGESASNRLGIGAGFSVDASNNVWKSGTIIGTLNANGGQGTNALIVSFKATASRAVVKELVRAITFKTVNGTAGQRTATFSLSDGDGGTSLDITKTINVT